ncbi:Maf family protein, partial [candidate division WOR-3 bacterium]|nr:Maf family protein [candidate division WOR-3 bacterium]
MRFILASASPRREELLRTLIPSFDVIKSGIDESLIDNTNAVEFALKASEAKAESVALNIKKGVIISADTVVSLNGSIIGKPQNERDAYDILSRLSGSEHVVITSLCIIVKNSRGLKKISDYEET